MLQEILDATAWKFCSSDAAMLSPYGYAIVLVFLPYNPVDDMLFTEESPTLLFRLLIGRNSANAQKIIPCF
eukprot:8836801-Ditylum_brightwellii.AAC.1